MPKMFVSNIVRRTQIPLSARSPAVLPGTDWNGMFTANAKSRSGNRNRFATSGAKPAKYRGVLVNPTTATAGDGATEDGDPVADPESENSAYPGNDEDQTDSSPDEVEDTNTGSITRRDGQDYGNDGHGADGRAAHPNDPGIPKVGKVDLTGVGKTSAGGLPLNTPMVKPLLSPVMDFSKRRNSGQDVNKDLPRRSPADLLHDSCDVAPDGSEPDRSPVNAFGIQVMVRKSKIAQAVQPRRK